MSNNWLLYSPLEREWSFLEIEQVITNTGLAFSYASFDIFTIISIDMERQEDVFQLEFEQDDFINIIFFREHALDIGFAVVKALAQALGEDAFLVQDSGLYNIPVHLLDNWADRLKLPDDLQNMDIAEAREYALQKVGIG